MCSDVGDYEKWKNEYLLKERRFGAITQNEEVCHQSVFELKEKCKINSKPKVENRNWGLEILTL